MKELERIGVQKFIATDFYNKIKSLGFSDVEIMGGAPRDWDREIHASDIDIFIGWISDEEQVRKVTQNSGIFFRKIESSDKRYENPDIYSVWESESYHGETIQLIFLKISTAMAMQSFPLNMSMVRYDCFSGECVGNYFYNIGKENKVLIVNPDLEHVADRYINKIRGRLGEYCFYEDLSSFIFDNPKEQLDAAPF